MLLFRRARGGEAATLLADASGWSWWHARWWLRHPRARGSGLHERFAFAPALGAGSGQRSTECDLVAAVRRRPWTLVPGTVPGTKNAAYVTARQVSG